MHTPVIVLIIVLAVLAAAAGTAVLILWRELGAVTKRVQALDERLTTVSNQTAATKDSLLQIELRVVETFMTEDACLQNHAGFEQALKTILGKVEKLRKVIVGDQDV